MPRCSSRPSFIERGKRLSTRALALTLISGVIVGVTGAAGPSTSSTPAHAVTLQSAAFVAPSSTALPVSLTHASATPVEGMSRPVVLGREPGPIVVGGQVPHSYYPITVGQGSGNGQGHVPTGDPTPGVPTGDPTPTPTPVTGGPTGDPGHSGPTGDPTPGVPTGDPTPGVPTGDPNGDKHRRHDGGQGGGNSGQNNPPVANPAPAPPPATPTPTPTPTQHSPQQPPVTTTPAATTPTTSPTPGPTKTPTGTPKGNGGTGQGATGFKLSAPTPVLTRHSHTRRATNPLLSAAGSGLGLPLARVAADAARLAGAAGLPSGTVGSGLSPAQVAAQAAARQAAARKAAAAKLAADRKRAKNAAPSFSSILAQPMVQFVKFIPSSVWLALAASLGLAAMGASAAIVAGRRARRQANRVAEVSAVALTDPLTGVLNRRGFIEAAERELDRAARHQRPFVLAYIDVRGLKRINDSEGHMAGDQLLKIAAAALTDSVRAHDVVGRLGGDEFGLLLTEQTALDGEHVAARIAEQVAISRAELGFAGHWDLTVGLAAFPSDGSSVDELLSTADRRLYEQRGIALAGAR